MSDREERIVRELLGVMAQGDIAGCANYFADNGSYRMNAWHPPIVGVEAIRADFERQTAGGVASANDLLNIASAGAVVFVERIDRGQSQGKDMAVHGVGVFELDPSGKITSWRDYYDRAEVDSQRGG